MSAQVIEDTFAQFWETLLFEAAVSEEPQAAAFFSLYAKLAAENGDTNDLTYTPVRQEGRGGHQIDGYAIDLERGELFLAVSDFRASRDIETLNAAQIDSLFERVRRFCEQAVRPEFINAIEETSPAFEAAWPIFENRTHIRRINVVAFSNARLSTRRKPEATGEALGVPFVCSVLDFVRFADISAARAGAEPIEIDVMEFNGAPLPCLPAHSIEGKHASYLLAVPGTFLAKVYGAYRARLLEQNVRTFLQAKTKVNVGIIRTLESDPEMFFAFNNGLTATAAGITTERMEDGNLGIVAIQNLQIVNGGQTTASILYASDEKRRDRRADLSLVFVQMKLSVVNPELLDQIVPKISRYANTQNKVSEADFLSSEAVHLVLERISRQLSAPARLGSLSGSKWFYERARGQYQDRLPSSKGAERRRFELEFPRDQLIDKTDLAKYEVTFECKPHIVSRGAQKCFLEYTDTVATAWEASELSFNEQWFRDVVAKAVIFRRTDKLIGSADWYQENRGYKAQAVTYTIAWLVNHLQSLALEIDFGLVWQRQEVPEKLSEVLRQVAPQVAATIKDAPSQMKNVGEYCKQQACWAAVSRSQYTYNETLDGFVIERAEAAQRKKQSVAAKKVDNDIDFDRLVVGLLSKTEPCHSFAREKGVLTPNSDAALRRLARGDIRVTPAERSALKSMFEKMRAKGFDIQ
jgi:hypothetical protein